MTERGRRRSATATRHSQLALPLVAFLVLAACRQETMPYEGRLDDGAAWIAEVPDDWNGTLLLYAHGYNPELRPAKSAPDNVREQLLAAGFALAASAYPSAGWAVADAIPSQLEALDAFAQKFGKPDRVIAWGSSMGGLVTSALAEQHAHRLDGALTMCASSMGALPMMNMAFDGAFALTTLIPADPPVAVLGEGDNLDGVARQMAAVEIARTAPAGRARVALAGVLAGIPGWTRPESSRPDETDITAQEADIAAMLKWGVFLPRGDQESRAGGNYSWNEGIDYAALLDASGRAAFVRALYDEAGLDLAEDLARLAAAPRQAADPAAVGYMREGYTSTGRAGVPVLSVHTIGDGLTSPSLQQSYVDKVSAAAGADRVADLWIERAGHCTQTAEESLAALEVLLERIETGRWDIDLATLHADERRFIDYAAPPMPRVAAGYTELPE